MLFVCLLCLCYVTSPMVSVSTRHCCSGAGGGKNTCCKSVTVGVLDITASVPIVILLILLREEQVKVGVTVGVGRFSMSVRASESERKPSDTKDGVLIAEAE